MNKQDRLIEILIQKNIFKLPDGRDLYEGTEEELVRLLRRCKWIGKRNSCERVPKEEKI
ncbi:hypothetical protein CN404_04175 [Bacillus thuringiensis]|uniref:Fur-regulated basic protein FbpA n=1 Tax=Bacillus thuringiensis TaxID=1428 RepID=UPI000BF680F5|nr:Fur-regulated basic protein FbpA [Bacillus thuringiensis]PFB55400.1 hypothetical protein CN404_04175 [Bacillus thuringiensis]